MPRDLESLADVVVMCVKNAMAPVLERVALVEQENVRLRADLATVGTLRDRLVTVETKAMMPAPAIAEPPQIDLTPIVERVAALEATVQRMPATEQQLADLRDRVVTVETKAAMPVQPPAVVEAEAIDLSPVLERVAALEAKSERVTAIVEHVVETKSASVTGPALTSTDVELLFRKSVEPVQALVAEARERLIAVEARAPIPGPPGKDGANGIDGKDGADGQPGKDGLGFDDLDMEFDGDRTMSLKFVRGKEVKRWPVVLPYQRNQGVFIEGKAYSEGDIVTWAGSSWHANHPTSAKPGEGSKDWTLVVKRGRDGKDGRDAVDPMPVVSVKR